mgnify:CR=1 FL=1
MNELILNSTSVNFLEANTNAISFEELTEQCVVPTWANQELTISHQDFISTVHDAACNVFAGETINTPEIRVSHIVRGRIPSALGKRSSELLESEKTQFYISFIVDKSCIIMHFIHFFYNIFWSNSPHQISNIKPGFNPLHQRILAVI